MSAGLLVVDELVRVAGPRLAGLAPLPVVRLAVLVAVDDAPPAAPHLVHPEAVAHLAALARARADVLTLNNGELKSGDKIRL